MTENVSKIDEKMGIWQLAAVAHLLDVDINSIYPNLGWDVAIKLNDRFIKPSRNSNTTWHILWSSGREDMTPEHWVPNHFVPLLPMYCTSDARADSGDADADMSPSEGDHFLTIFHGREYVARVLKCLPDENLVQLAYMCEKSADSGIWYWPTVEDLSHEPVSNLLRKVQLVMDEKISNQRMQYYKVTK